MQVTSIAVQDRFLRLPEVRKMIPYSRTTIYRKMAAGDFPLQVSLGPGVAAWLQSEVVAWMNARIAERAPISLRSSAEGT